MSKASKKQQAAAVPDHTVQAEVSPVAATPPPVHGPEIPTAVPPPNPLAAIGK